VTAETAAICAVAVLLIPLAFAGLALMNAGFVRSRGAAHVLLTTLAAAAIAALAYVVCGYSFQAFPGRPAFAFFLGDKQWDWIGADAWFLRGLDFDGSPLGLAACSGMFAAAWTALIPIGAAAERWRWSAAATVAAVIGGWIYPVFGHWVWGGGWLAQLGANYGAGSGFIDGGAGAIQVTGGLAALSIAWITGPRRGKYSPEGVPVAFPGHNAIFVLFGGLLALAGWLGLNSAAAILDYNVPPPRLALIAINTVLCAGSALLSSALITRARFSKPDASLSANGWTGGLVASSAAAAFLAPAGAIIVGLAAGALAPYSIEWLEVHFGIDDPGGAISVHAVCGLWGLLAAGMFGRFPGGASGQWIAQVAGIATLLGCVFPLTYLICWALNVIVPFRLPIDGERQGADLHELGANAYPELVSHLEDFTQR